MSKPPELSLLGLPFGTIDRTPLALTESWLKLYAGMIASMKDLTGRCYRHQAAEIAALHDAVSRVSACKGPDEFFEAQSRYASGVAERFAAHVSGLGGDILALGAAATGTSGGPDASPPEKTTGKAAA